MNMSLEREQLGNMELGLNNIREKTIKYLLNLSRELPKNIYNIEPVFTEKEQGSVINGFEVLDKSPYIKIWVEDCEQNSQAYKIDNSFTIDDLLHVYQEMISIAEKQS